MANTGNDFLVSSQGNGSFMIVNQKMVARPFTKEQALLLAAWLVALASDDDKEWEDLLDAVRNT